MQVTVLHKSACLMDRQLDSAAAGLLRQALERKGLQFRMRAETAAILGTGGSGSCNGSGGGVRAGAVQLADGSVITADLVVMTAGVRPDIGLAQSAGLFCERAIVVDDTLQSYDPRIYAVGECVQHRQATFGLVAPIWDQARVCGAHLAGAGHRRYVQQATATRLKVSGIDLYSAGDTVGGAGTEDLLLRDPRHGVYKRLILQDRRLVGAVLYGDVADGGFYFDLIQSGADISAQRHTLVFGPAAEA